MQVLSSPTEVAALSLNMRRLGKRVAFVPTMGALHAGHLALIEAAKRHGDWVVVSIFVNPTQFGPAEDFGRYPRPLEADRQTCEAGGVDLLFTPSREDVYAPDHSVYVVEGNLTRGLCGPHRPGHFRGVLTVVAILLNIALPDVAIFGQKDAQQARLIQRMVRDLRMATRILIAPTVREQDGLALSSRNQYLTEEERCRACVLSEALRLAESCYAAGDRDAVQVCARMRARCEAVVPASAVEYIEAVDFEGLAPVTTLADGTLLALCVRVGKTRLIDNVILGRPHMAAAYGLLA